MNEQKYLHSTKVHSKKMIKLVKVTKFAINLSLILICIINSLLVIERILKPTIPTTQVLETNLSDIEFPVSFRICFFDHDNNGQKYEHLGYHGVIDFFQGRSKYNYSHIGWNGHTKNGETIGPIEGIH